MLKRICLITFLFFLAGCAVPLCPIPIRPFAPNIPPLPEHKKVSVIEQSMAAETTGTKNVLLAMRSGQPMGVTIKRLEEKISDRPSYQMNFKIARRAYIPPPRFIPPREGDNHYFNFKITREFAEANNYYLAGNGEDALEVIDKILSSPGNKPTLYWQASFLRIMTLVMMGKFQIAEEEVARSEEFEIASLDRNLGSRSVRAEVRYWAGDFEGAKADAEQVLSAIGSWRFPSSYESPPIDQRRLADTTAAQARSAIVLGLIYFSEGNYEGALPLLELADQTMNDVVGVSINPLYGLYFPIYQEVFYARGMASMALGAVLLVMDPSSERAQRIFEQGKEYFDAIGYTLGKILIYNFKTFAYYKAGYYREAIVEAEKGLKIAEQEELLDYVWRLETLRARCLIRLNDWEKAEMAMRHAQSIVDLMAGTMVTDEAKVRFGAGKEVITNTLAEIDLRNNDFDSLFQDLERGRARAFVSMLANKIYIAGREESLVKKIRELDNEILKIRQKKYAMSSSQYNVDKNETVLLKERESLISDLRKRDKELADTLSVSTASLNEVRQRLAKDEAIFYTLPLEEDKNIKLLIVEKDNVSIKQLKANAAQLRNYLKSFTLSIMKSGISTSIKDSSLTQLQDLFNFMSDKEYKSAYLVPSGDLFFIPWGALDLNYPVSVIPTGSWIIRSGAALFSGKELKAAVVGDPNFGGIFPQLPGAEKEAIAVGKHYHCSPLLGSAATEEALRGKIKDGIEIVHLATHALFDPVFPLQSALILTNGQQARPLTAQELFEQPLKANLVILSACETGLGQVASGDDLLGLNRSFYLGGTNTIISSLWPVADEPTKIFMEHFHKGIEDGEYGRAWIMARNVLKQKGFPASVYGSFNINGLLSSRIVQ